MKELDEKTKAMLKLIEEDADSFARRAEMYYKKRPELINMVEDFYRAHRSLAERYDQIRSDPGARLGPTLSSPFLSNKYQQQEKPTSPSREESCNNFTTITGSPFSYNKLGQEKLMMKKFYDSYSESCESELSGESEIDDPEQEDCIQDDKELVEEEEVSSKVSHAEVMKLSEEIERLKEENKIQKEQLLQKDEEKREVIRQLSLAIQVLKEENDSLMKSATKTSSSLMKSVTKTSSKKWNPIELNKLKGAFLGKFFLGSPRSVVAL